jgi:hypothetical protein
VSRLDWQSLQGSPRRMRFAAFVVAAGIEATITDRRLTF